MRAAIGAAILACAAAVAASGEALAQGATSPQCREFTVPVIIGGQQQQAVGQACLQADGSWRISPNTPSLEAQAAAGPPQAAVPPPTIFYPVPAPLWASNPWFFGPSFGFGASFVFVDRFHPRHRFHRNDFRRAGFHGRRH